MPATSERTGRRPERLAFLHGFTQTHHHWHPVAHLVDRLVTERLGDRGRRCELVLPDLPGHGLSADASADIDDAAVELARTVGPATYIGYSMGGRVALHVALVADSPVERLVLLGATPGLDDPDERTARRRSDEELARRIEAIGVDAFVDEWLAGPLFAGLPVDHDDRVHRRRNTAAGLANSLRTTGTGAQRSRWSELGRIGVPTLILAGALDTKFTAIGRAMAEAIPNADFRPIADAGHAVHGERPDAVAELIADWIARRPAASTLASPERETDR